MKPQQNSYFTYTEFRAKNAQKTLFFFPAGFTKLSLYRFTIRQLNKMGIEVVGFDFDWKQAVRQSDLNGLRKLVTEVDAVVSDYIDRTKSNQTYAVFGTSFGGVLALYTAKRHQEINAVILSVPHATLSKVLWTFKPSKPFKDTLVRDGIRDERQLNKLLGDIEAQCDLHLLKNKKIVNFTALNDSIVTDGLDLANALKAASPNTILYKNRFGHLLGGTLGIASKRKWYVVLKDN
jgi:pimeloyl-ACP methyl ester carboxylesterase